MFTALKKNIYSKALELVVGYTVCVQLYWFLSRRGGELGDIADTHLLILDLVGFIFLTPVFEEISFRFWLPRERNSLGFWQLVWFWVWLLFVSLFLLPMFLGGRILFDFYTLVIWALMLWEALTGIDSRGVHAILDLLFNVRIQLIGALPIAYLLARIFGNMLLKKTPSNWWYVLSTVFFAMAHFPIVQGLAEESRVEAIFLVFNYLYVGGMLSLVYRKYGIKTAILTHAFFNLLAYLSSTAAVLF